MANPGDPEFLLSVMDRHREWCCVICLIGGGEEINTGEAGLGEWFRALSGQRERWRVAISDQLNGPEYAWNDLDTALSTVDYEIFPDLHLGVSVRSFRSENVARLVSAVIEGDAVGARSETRTLEQYPIVLTRNLAAARSWLKRRARGSERIGLVASFNGLRLKPEGIHVKSKIDVAHWFLAGREDVRSSYALEDAASEFDIQGLELDWEGVCWDANVRFTDGAWSLHRFAGSSWKNVRDELARIYLKNAYRVLL